MEGFETWTRNGAILLSNFQIREDFLPYNQPDITDAEVNEVVDTLRSGWIARGPRTVKFEAAFAEYLGAKHALDRKSVV